LGAGYGRLLAILSVLLGTFNAYKFMVLLAKQC
jgi:hypothetical protein